MKLMISLVVVAVIAVMLSRSLKLSSKYERSPKSVTDKKLSEWSALDHGIDPTEDHK
jgi:hypothetical protein